MFGLRAQFSNAIEVVCTFFFQVVGFVSVFLLVFISQMYQELVIFFEFFL